MATASEQIRNCAIALGALMHDVPDEHAALIRVVRQNLLAAADQAQALERKPLLLVVPGVAHEPRA
ncbi:hypothetical protein [Megalodesulfovibrio paquesii]